MINGATKEIGRAAILAVTKARGMEVAAAVDNQLVGQDAGKVLYLYIWFFSCCVLFICNCT